MPKPTDAQLAAALRPLADALITPETIRREKEHDSTHREDGQLRAEKVEGRLRNNRTGVIDSQSVQVPATSAGPAGSLKDHLTGVATAIASAGLTTEQVQDLVAAFVVAGDNITAVYDDVAGTLTLASTGGGTCELLIDETGDVILDEFGDPILVGECDADTGAYALGLIDTHIAATSGAHGITPFGASLIDDANAAAVLTTLGITAAVAELNYTDGVTSAIQTQLDGKQPLDSDLTTIAGLTATTDNVIQSVAGAWASRTMAQFKTALALTLADIVAALGYTPVNKAGDTMSGGLTVSDGGITLNGSTAFVVRDSQTQTAIFQRFTANAVGPRMDFEKSRNSTPEAHTVVSSGDVLADVRLRGSDGAAFRDAASIQAKADGAPSGTTVPGRLEINTTPAGGGQTLRFVIYSTGNVVINEPGVDADFRVEGDTDTNLLFTDASTDRVGIGTATPAAKLHVNGAAQIDGTLTLSAQNIATDTTTGMKVGTATTQKLGFYNATPVVQPSAYTQTYTTASKTMPATTQLTTPAGGIGTAAGGWDTAGNRDLAIASINAARTDIDALKQVVTQLIDDLQALGLVG